MGTASMLSPHHRPHTVRPITGTVGVMAATGIELQRISLGAMMIAMGMLVDNGIVIAEDIRSRLERGEDKRQAELSWWRRARQALGNQAQARDVQNTDMLAIDVDNACLLQSRNDTADGFG